MSALKLVWVGIFAGLSLTLNPVAPILCVLPRVFFHFFLTISSFNLRGWLFSSFGLVLLLFLFLSSFPFFLRFFFLFGSFFWKIALDQFSRLDWLVVHFDKTKGRNEGAHLGDLLKPGDHLAQELYKPRVHHHLKSGRKKTYKNKIGGG